MRMVLTYSLFILVVGLALPASLQAQQRRHTFERITTEEGLSSNGINAILHDSRGFLWFGTASGLNHYDGYRFRTYANVPLDSTSLAHNWVFTIYEDRAGIIWVGTRGDGLDRFDPETGTFAHYRHEVGNPNSLSDNNIRSIYEDRAGTLWVGTERGLNTMDRATGRFVLYRPEEGHLQGTSPSTVFAIYEDRGGVLWIGSRFGLDQLDRTTGAFTHFELDNPRPDHTELLIYAICEDRAGTFWIGTSQGLARLDPTTGRFTLIKKEAAPSDKAYVVQAIHEDQAGRLWIGSTYGLERIDPTTGQLAAVPFEDKNSSYLVLAIGEDASGVLWVGTEDEGLYKLKRAKERFAQYTHEPDNPQSLSNPHVRAVYEDRAGVLWFGTRDGLDRYDRATGRFTHYQHEQRNPKSLSANTITAIHEDQAGGLWVVAYDAGLNRLDRATGAFTRYTLEASNPNSLSSKIVRAVYESPAEPGVLWIATKKGLDRLDIATATFTHYRHDHAVATSLSHNSTRTLYEDRAGMLWIGTDGGLNAFDRAAGTFARYQHKQGDPNSLSNNEVRSIYEDQSGTLWVGTKGGLNKFVRDEARFIWYTEQDGLLGNFVYGIIEDDHGYLWICNNQGVSKFDPANETMRNYGRNDGLLNSLVRANAYIRSHSGHLLQGGDQGVTVFHPDSLQDNPHIPPVVLTDFKKRGQSTSFDTAIHAVEEITLSHTDNFFSFEFAALDYRNPSSNQYAYQLQGLDADWVYAGTRRLADYTDVDPGDYVFRVKGSNNDGLWNEDGLSVRVIITPPFWQRGWFRMLGFVSIAGLLLAAYRYRVRSITVRNQALQKEIDERKRVEEALRKSEADLMEAQKISHIGSWEWDLPTGSVRYSDENFRIFGLEPQSVEISFELFLEAVHPDDRAVMHEVVQRAMRQEKVAPFEYRIILADGEERFLVSHAEATFDAEGHVLRLFGTTQDITERKRAERERETLIGDLEAKNGELERFTYTVSHDLKTPLVTIKGFLGLLQQDAARGDIERMNQDVAQIGEAADKMSRLLSELLELSRIGRQVNPPEAVSLSDLAREAVALVAGPIQNGGVTVEIDPRMPEVYGDRVRLLEVFQNLVDNAVKFMGFQPAPRVEVAARVDGGEVLCSVQDNGLGIDPRYHETVFGLFNRLEVQAEGTGIGLALVKRIVEVHGGRIWIESDGEGCGSTFFLTLPWNGQAEHNTERE